MPHSKPSATAGREPSAQLGRESSRAGAIVVGVLSGAILGGAVLSTSPSRASRDGASATAWRALRQALGLDAPSLELVPDSRTAHAESRAAAEDRASRGIVIAGRVLDALGNPVEGALVRVRSDARPHGDWVASTDSDGSFRIEGVGAGKVHVAAQDVEAGLVESTSMEAAESRHVVLVLDRTFELEGAVLDERGAAVPRATLKCLDPVGAPGRIVVANEDGRFKLRAPFRSVDRIAVWARGFEATSIAIGPYSETMRRNVRLRAARRFHGVVLDPSGAPVEGARVSACPGNEAEIATSDGAGAFDLPATVIGCWLTAAHGRYAPSRGARIADARDLVVQLGSGGAIEGVAVDEHGKSVGLFSVSIASFEPEEGDATPTTRTGETSDYLRGDFRLDDLAPGSYVLNAHAEGRIAATSGAIVVARGRVIRGARFVLPVIADEASMAPPVTIDTTSDTTEARATTEAAEAASDPPESEQVETPD